MKSPWCIVAASSGVCGGAGVGSGCGSPFGAKGATETATCIVVEAALLIEAGWADLVDEIWLVTTDDASAFERLMVRNPDLSEEEALGRLAAQAQQTSRRREQCHVEIENRAGVGALEHKVQAAVTEILTARRPTNFPSLKPLCSSQPSSHSRPSLL
mmetsp:Transcript_15819/g.21305  ORF Transcript_15819/g.21305 Transcript_15819/m.21305 type:complete len:157 (-) Transcript_15819:191-661(-)